MKRDKAQKKKWLWLVLALVAVVAAAGAALVLLLPQGQKQAQEPVGPAALYWNVDRLANLEEGSGMSIRTKGEDGLFHIRFAISGQQTELPVIDDKRLVNYIDSLDVMGLVFDGEGVIVDVVDPKTIADEAAKDFFVKKIDGKTLYLNSSLAMNGMDIEIALSDATGIYDVDPDTDVVGKPGELQALDNVIIYSEKGTQNITHVFITEHPDDGEIFWNLTRSWDKTKGSTSRVPDENGVYTLQMAHKGELVELKCKDIDIVNTIDSQVENEQQCALQLDAEGYIVGIVDFTTALRARYLASQFWITEINGDVYTATKLSGSDNGKVVTFTLPENCEIYQCCVNGCQENHCGERIEELRLGDRINAFADLDGNVKLIFVSMRSVDSPMYYNFNRQNNTDGTTRKPDNKGYYHFELLKDGVVVEVRAPSKEIADQMDGIYNCGMGLVLNGDVVERVYSGDCVSGYSNTGSYSIVQSFSGSIVSFAAASSSYVWNKLLSPDCVVYNAITGEYGAKIGGTTTLQIGDTVNGFRNMYDQVCVVFVTARFEEGAKVYYNLDRSYNSTKKETNRLPDADGYYVFEMACEGKVVTVMTKSKGMASFIDEQQAPLVGLKVNKNGLITNAYVVTSALRGQAKACNYRYVENVKGNTFNTYYYPSATPDVKMVDSDTYTMAKDCVVYNVSATYTKNRGEITTLKNGDYIQAIRDLKTNQITQIYIMQRDPTYGVASYNANCSHCGKNVTWTPYNGKVASEGGHYFMCAGIAHNQVSFGKKDDGKVNELVLDLKGYTLTGTSRVFLVYDHLTIMDTKGGGKIVGTTKNGSIPAGSAIMVGDGGSLDILGGELTQKQNATDYGATGGVLYIGKESVVNMSGGKITGGTATERGGNIINYGGTLNIMDGILTGGTAPSGANYYGASNSKLNISGGTVDGGIYVISTGAVTLSGAPVIGGTGLEVAQGLKISVEDLTQGASIVVNADGVFTESLTNAENYLQYFKTAKEEDSIGIVNGALHYIKKPVDFNGVDNSDLVFASGTMNAYCSVCDAVVTWTALTDKALKLSAGKHYYLAQDLYYQGDDSFLTAPGAGKVCVHLNGHNITAASQRVIQGSGGTLNILGNGTVTGGYKITGSYILSGTVGINTNIAGGTINLIGGTYTSDTNAPVVAISNNGGRINMYAGAAIRGDSDTRSVYVGSADLINADFNIYGGKIEGGSVYMTGANVAKGNTVTMTISGGTVTGGIEIAANSKLVLSGAPTIAEEPLKIPAGVTVELGELASSASILVTADGVFTTANEKAADYAQNFHTKKPDTDRIIVENGALCYVKPAIGPEKINEDLVFTADTTNAFCPVCEKDVTWTALSADTALNIPSGMHYYLDSDLIYNGSEDCFLTAPGTGGVACVHLNGHNLTAVKRVFQGNAGILNIMGNGRVSGNFNKTGAWNSAAGATVGINTTGANGTINLYGGTYVKSASNTTNATVAIAPNGGMINLYEGAVIDGTALPGANVSVCNGTFNMYGGQILGGSGQSVRVVSGPTNKSGTFIMKAGLITGCAGEQMYVCGIAEAPAMCALFGGTVDGKMSVDSYGDFGVTGNPVVTGLYLADGVKIHVAELTDGAKITVSANGVFTYADENAVAYAQYFEPLNEGDQIIEQESALCYVKVEQGGDDTGEDNPYTKDLAFEQGTTDALCPVCEKDVTWTALNASAPMKLSSGVHYYLDSDLVYDGNEDSFFTAPGTGSVTCVHLNGHNITTTGQRVFQGNAGILNIMGNGRVSGNFNQTGSWSSVAGATVGINTTGVNGAINLYGGTYVKSASNTTHATVAIAPNGGKINLYEGAVIDGTALPGANVSVCNGTFNMYGGQILGGSAQSVRVVSGPSNKSGTFIMEAGLISGCAGEQIYVSGIADAPAVCALLGGTVDGKITVDAYGEFSVAGAPVVTGLHLADGIKIHVTELTDGAKVTVSANGVFTYADENAVAYAQYFEPLNEGDRIVEQESALCYVKAELGGEGSGEDNPYTKDLVFDQGTTDALCPVCGEKKTWTAITNGDSLGTKNDGGHHHLYLTKDVSNRGAGNYLLINGASVCLHLNGYSITNVGRIFVTNGSDKTSTLNIMGNGTVMSTGAVNADGTVVVAGSASTANLYGGTYQYQGADTAPVRLNATGASVNLYEGASVQGTETVGVLCGSGTLSVNGCNITGGISAVKGTVNLAGASTVDGITVAKNAKLVVKADFTGTAVASFAALSDNTIPAANGASEGEYTGALHLDSQSGPAVIGRDGALVIESSGEENAYTKDLVFDEGTTDAICPACGEKKTWTAISGTGALGTSVTTGGHYYLANDIVNTTSQNYMQINGKNVCLHLNGHDLTYAGRILVTNLRDTTSLLNIMGSGTVKSTATTVDYGTININGSASVANLYGGTYLYEGTAYAPVYLDQNTATVNLYDTVVVDGGEKVGILVNRGIVTFSGGTVNGGISAVTGTVNLGGASVVDSITVDNGAKLVVKADFTGTAAASFAALADNVIPEANGVSEGAFTGKLYLNAEGSPAIVDQNGKLVLVMG